MLTHPMRVYVKRVLVTVLIAVAVIEVYEISMWTYIIHSWY